MKIVKYQEEYRQQVIDLVLHIQNDEAKTNLLIGEQPDLRGSAEKNCHFIMNILTGILIYTC